MFKKVILILVLALSPAFAMVSFSQELNCTVDVVSPQIQDAAAQTLFKNMKDAIYQFINSTKWTNDNFGTQEKIDCSIFINITAENSPSDFNATMQIQSRRPIYKASYNSVQLNLQDNNIHLVYVLNQPLLFNINTYSDNITSLLAFYAYIIIGTDYDTYAMNGGSPYYLKAQTVVLNAQSAGEKGWNPQDGDQTRYWLVNNLLDESYYAPLRKAAYEYHRQGLDVMAQDAVKGRTQIIDALTQVQNVYNVRPANYNVQLFFNAKAAEIVNIFSEASPEEKSKVYGIVSTIDPTDM
ncbi:MAG TPA: DUF4835 family protein, partial [Bacteroidia bacterium]|nr:DUF4835 family protein [Bacteroidia bacterium]